MNPYCSPMEPYPSIMDIPPEGGSINLSFESNFFIDGYLVNSNESGFKLIDSEQEFNQFYRRLELTVSAGPNNTQGDLIDTLYVSYNFPTILLPVYATKIIGDYIIRQNPL